MKSNNNLKSLALVFAYFPIRNPLLYPLSYGGGNKFFEFVLDRLATFVKSRFVQREDYKKAEL